MRSLIPLVFGLCACAHTPPSSFTFNPLEDDPAGSVFALAFAPPQAQSPEALLLLGARHPDGRRVEESFVLEAFTGGLPTGAEHGYRVAQQDQARLAATRSLIAGWKDEAPGTKGSLSVTVDPCVSDLLPEALSVWVQTGPDDPFTPLVLNEPIRERGASCPA